VPGFADVRTGDWFYADFAQALRAGIVSDEPDDRFRPYSQVSRALFTVWLMRTMAPDEIASLGAAPADDGRDDDSDGSDAGRAANVGAGDDDDEGEDGGAAPAPQPIFNDVSTTYWAHNEIEAAARLGLVRGTGDGSSFSPDALVTRAQMATMMCRALGAGSLTGGAAYALYDDVPKGYWAEGSIVTMYTYGLMCGDAQGCFRPVENTNRAQAITVMARLLRLLQGEAGS